MLSWAIGSSLAALAGVLLVSTVGLDYYNLTFLVINSFAAAMLGRLSSLPLTYVGAIVLGLLIEYSRGYVHGGQLIENGLQTSLPTVMLFAILIFVPQVRLRVGQVKGILAANVPSGAPGARRRPPASSWPRSSSCSSWTRPTRSASASRSPTASRCSRWCC